MVTNGTLEVQLNRGYMEQIIFDGGYLLRPATFLEDLKGSLFI